MVFLDKWVRKGRVFQTEGTAHAEAQSVTVTQEEPARLHKSTKMGGEGELEESGGR